MLRYMKTGTMLLSIAYIVLGLMLLIVPERSLLMICYVFGAVVLITVLAPVLNIFAVSFSSYDAFARGDVGLLPVEFSTKAYETIIRDGKTLGAIGVLGPARMDYAKVLATLEELSGNITTMLDSDPNALARAGDNKRLKDASDHGV